MGRIHAHEESAEVALWTTIALGVFALGALALPVRLARTKRAATAGAVVLTLVGFAMVARTASLGGHISHPEITGGSSFVPGGGALGEDEGRER